MRGNRGQGPRRRVALRRLLVAVEALRHLEFTRDGLDRFRQTNK